VQIYDMDTRYMKKFVNHAGPHRCEDIPFLLQDKHSKLIRDYCKTWVVVVESEIRCSSSTNERTLIMLVFIRKHSMRLRVQYSTANPDDLHVQLQHYSDIRRIDLGPPGTPVNQRDLRFKDHFTQHHSDAMNRDYDMFDVFRLCTHIDPAKIESASRITIVQ
jgi:hypothetical protein